MPRSYAMDLREHVVMSAHDKGLTQPALAARFRISVGTMRTGSDLA